MLFIVLGSVLEGLPAMVLFGPLLFPVAQQLGIHLVQYAIVAILAMGIGLFSPPFGVGFYQTCLIGKRAERRGVRPHLALYGDARRGAGGGRGGAVDLDGVPALSPA